MGRVKFVNFGEYVRSMKKLIASIKEFFEPRMVFAITSSDFCLGLKKREGITFVTIAFELKGSFSHYQQLAEECFYHDDCNLARVQQKHMNIIAMMEDVKNCDSEGLNLPDNDYYLEVTLRVCRDEVFLKSYLRFENKINKFIESTELEPVSDLKYYLENRILVRPKKKPASSVGVDSFDGMWKGQEIKLDMKRS